jgi:hypothetical protein
MARREGFDDLFEWLNRNLEINKTWTALDFGFGRNGHGLFHRWLEVTDNVRTFFDSRILQQPRDIGRVPPRDLIAGLPHKPLPDSIVVEDPLAISDASAARQLVASSGPTSISSCEISEARPELSGRTTKTNNKLDFVVVTFPAEIEMLYLQLKSIEKFVDTETMGRLYIFWNSSTQKTATYIRDARAFIAGLAGLRDRTEFLLRDDIFGADDLFDSDGWRAQQALKIASSRFVREDFAVVLDTKNHFIRRVNYDDFISPEGRPYSHFVNYSRSIISFPKFLKNCCIYFGIPFDEAFSRTGMPTFTPLTIKKSILRALLNLIEHREGTNILRAFFCSNDLKDTTEFLLYYAFILKEFGRARDVYDRSSPIAVTFFSTGILQMAPV